MNRVAKAFKTAMISMLALWAAGCCSCWNQDLRAKAVRKEAAAYSLAASGGRVELSTFNGSIHATGAEGSEARIEWTVTCHARTQEEADGGLDLVHPELENKVGFLSFKFSDPRIRSLQHSVSLKVEVPRESSVVLRTSNGEIEVAGVRGEIDARTTNGRVAARDGGRRENHLHTSNGEIVAERISGSIDAETSNGGVRIEPAGIDEIQARTSNGPIRCILPPSYAGELEADTSLGHIRCDFPVRIQAGAIGKSHIRGTIGAGGPRLRLATSLGSIEILSRGGPAEMPPSPPAPGAGGSAQPSGTRKI